MVLHVCWEKTLFGMLYQKPARNLFKTTLANMVPAVPIYYSELFYISSPGNLGSFTYQHCPYSRLTRTHIALWTGHTEQLQFRVHGAQLTSFTLDSEGAPLSVPVRELLQLKHDNCILLVQVK